MAKNKDLSNVVSATISNGIVMSELKKMIKSRVEIIMKNPDKSMEISPILIHSAPGIGKSSVCQQIAQELGIDFINIKLCNIDALDFRGLPSVDQEKGVTKWNCPNFWPKDPNAKGIILLDEITACDSLVQKAAYEFVLERRIGEIYNVPKGYYILAAGNRACDKAIVAPISSALANRFCHVELSENSDDWRSWAITHDIHPSVLGFIQWQPQWLLHMKDEHLDRGFPTPRSWSRVSEEVKMWENDEHMLSKLVSGLVGDSASYEFMAFHKLNRKFANIREIMLNKDAKIELPKAPDELYAMTNAMTYLLWRGDSEAENNRLLDGFFRISLKLDSAFAALAMTAAMTANSEDKEKQRMASRMLFKHPMYKKWQETHGREFAKYVTNPDSL